MARSHCEHTPKSRPVCGSRVGTAQSRAGLRRHRCCVPRLGGLSRCTAFAPRQRRLQELQRSLATTQVHRSSRKKSVPPRPAVRNPAESGPLELDDLPPEHLRSTAQSGAYQRERVGDPTRPTRLDLAIPVLGSPPRSSSGQVLAQRPDEDDNLDASDDLFSTSTSTSQPTTLRSPTPSAPSGAGALGPRLRHSRNFVPLTASDIFVPESSRKFSWRPCFRPARRRTSALSLPYALAGRRRGKPSSVRATLQIGFSSCSRATSSPCAVVRQDRSHGSAKGTLRRNGLGGRHAEGSLRRVRDRCLPLGSRPRSRARTVRTISVRSRTSVVRPPRTSRCHACSHVPVVCVDSTG